MSKFVGFIVGAALIVAGILTGNPYLIIQGGMMIVSNAVMLLTMPKAPARQASEMSIALGEQPRCALFGETFTAGSLVDGFNYGGKYGTKFEVLVIRLADHKCEELVGFFVNDQFHAYAGDGDVPGFDDGDDAALQIFFRADTSSQALPSVVTSQGPGWSANDVGESGCDVVVVYEADKPDEKHPEWPGGRPRFGFVVKGKLCYDPRLDTTVGGSGAHRWDDPATWEWSDNPAVCRYNWARGIYANDKVYDPSQLLIGRGLTSVEAPPSNIFAAANLCDELVEGEKRYRVAGPVYASQAHLEVEEMFAAATGGSIVTVEGSVELEPGQAKSVVASFTDEDLLSGSKVGWNEAILSDSSGEWINSVVARYVEPTQKWNDHAAPVVRSTDDILADGRPRETSITLRFVRWVAQALRVAEIARRMGRVWGRASVTLGPRFCELEAGDWVNWTSARRFGGATRTFRIEAHSINEKWQNTLTLREIYASIFADDGVFDPDYSEANQPPPPPDIGAPEADSWALSATNLGSGGAVVPALVIEGACEDDFAEAIIFEYWQDDGVINPIADPDDPTWTVHGQLPPSTTRVEITSVQAGEDYYAAVTYAVDGEPGDRRVLGPATMQSAATALSFANNGATAPFSANASFYDATDDKTWVSWEVWDGSQRAVYVQTWEHADNRWGKPYLVSTDTLTDDDHGTPSIVMDHEGYVHCFFGVHNSALKHAVTSAARDPSAWVEQPSIGTDLTYPYPVLVGSTLYLFPRGNTLQSLIRYKTSALSGGVATWGAPQTVATFTGGRFYVGKAFAVGTKIHIAASYSDAGDTFRRDIYHLVYDTGDDGVENSTNGVNTAVGSQPISKATADASYIVVDQTTNVTGNFGMCRTSDGDLHLAYIDDSASPYDIKYINFDGASWSSPATIASLYATPTFGAILPVALLARADDSLDLIYTSDPAAAYATGGQIERVTRSLAGVWGTAIVLLSPPGTKGLSNTFAPLDHDEELFMLIGELAATSNDADAGDLKLYAYGSNGFLGATAPVFTSPPVISTDTGFYGVGDVFSVSFEHTGTSETYQWKAAGAAISGETGATYTGDAGELGDLITVTVTASNLAGTTNATPAGVGPLVTPTFETQTRTLSDLSNRTLSDTTNRTISNRMA